MINTATLPQGNRRCNFLNFKEISGVLYQLLSYPFKRQPLYFRNLLHYLLNIDRLVTCTSVWYWGNVRTIRLRHYRFEWQILDYIIIITSKGNYACKGKSASAFQQRLSLFDTAHVKMDITLDACRCFQHFKSICIGRFLRAVSDMKHQRLLELIGKCDMLFKCFLLLFHRVRLKTVII